LLCFWFASVFLCYLFMGASICWWCFNVPVVSRGYFLPVGDFPKFVDGMSQWKWLWCLFDFVRWKYNLFFLGVPILFPLGVFVLILLCNKFLFYMYTNIGLIKCSVHSWTGGVTVVVRMCSFCFPCSIVFVALQLKFGVLCMHCFVGSFCGYIFLIFAHLFIVIYFFSSDI